MGGWKDGRSENRWGGILVWRHLASHGSGYEAAQCLVHSAPISLPSVDNHLLITSLSPEDHLLVNCVLPYQLITFV